MATAQPDVQKMSYAELQKLLTAANEALASKRDEELKVICDGYVKKGQAAGFTIQELTEALKPYWPKRAVRASKPSSDNGLKPEPGATYKNPETGETWTRPKSGKGRTKSWLLALVDAGRKLEDLRVK